MYLISIHMLHLAFLANTVHSKEVHLCFQFDLLMGQSHTVSSVIINDERNKISCDVFNTFVIYADFFVTSLIKTARNKMAALVVVFQLRHLIVDV